MVFVQIVFVSLVCVATTALNSLETVLLAFCQKEWKHTTTTAGGHPLRGESQLSNKGRIMKESLGERGTRKLK